MSMKARLLLLAALCGCALLPASAARAASSGASTLNLASSASAFINVLDNTFTLTPTAADYNNDYVEATGASGLRMQVKTNSTTGMVLYVRCTDAAPQIALADLLVKTQTAPGPGGTSLTTYTAVSPLDRALWSTGAAQGPFLQVNMDVRIKNLFAYPDPINAGTTTYTDNLTFTVIAQ